MYMYVHDQEYMYYMYMCVLISPNERNNVNSWLHWQLYLVVIDHKKGHQVSKVGEEE